MAQVSRLRRSPVAGFVVVILALLVMGGLYSAFRPAAADSSSTDRALVAQGRRLYVVSCSSCHGLNGEGVRAKGGTNFGPPLIGVGAAACDFQVGTGRMPAARPGTQIEKRTPIFTPQEVRQLCTYLATLGPGPGIPSKEQYDPTGLSAQQVAEGGEIFRTNCTACHNYAGSGGTLLNGRYAPNLRGVQPKYIYEAMLTGPQQMPIFSDGVLTPEEKQKVIGYIQTLQGQPGYGGAKLGSLGPIPEGLFGWVLGIGSLVLVTVWIANNGARVRRRHR